jgi:hypothetical protein
VREERVSERKRGAKFVNCEEHQTDFATPISANYLRAGNVNKSNSISLD